MLVLTSSPRSWLRRMVIGLIFVDVVFLVYVILQSRDGTESSAFTRQQDVIYGRKFGTVLTMDVFTPRERVNGGAVVFVVSSGYVSSHQAIDLSRIEPFLVHGYTVFTVVHGSQPRYQVPEIVEDIRRAVRFIRGHALAFGIDANRIGITGGSAGGHLSLMMATTGGSGEPTAPDPVDRESSRVQAVACFYPPTDFLNWGASGHELLQSTDHQLPYAPAFDHHERDVRTSLWERITDAQRLRQIARDMSPIYHITPGAPPTLIVHGDHDTVVPLQQSQMFVEKLRQAGVETRLVVRQGAGHAWSDLNDDVEKLVDWFDVHLHGATGTRK
jgi:acetyl esterase/lipase